MRNSRSQGDSRKTYQMLARQKFSYAWWTAIVPLLMIISLTCSSIGRGSATTFFKEHWIIAILLVLVLTGLGRFAYVEIRQGLDFLKMSKTANRRVP